jgi:Domain of unknown function (DUF4177)
MWEYKLVSAVQFSPRRLETQLNELGAQGWELVMHYGKWYVFRRPKQG